MAESKKPSRTRKTTRAAQTRQDTPDVIAVTADSFVRVDQKDIVLGAATDVTSGDSKLLTVEMTADSAEGPGTIFPPSGASTGGITRIQDADDYALSQGPQPYVFTTRHPNGVFEETFKWNSGFVGGAPPGASYFTWAKNAQANAEIMALVAGDDLSFTFDSGDVFQTTVSRAGASNSSSTNYIELTDTWPDEHATSVGIAVDSSKFTNVGEIPLAEGDHLQWNEADQAFKPVQLETGGITRIQDAEDYGLEETTGARYTWQYNPENTGATVTKTGEAWSYIVYSDDLIFLSTIDSNGYDAEADLYATNANDTVLTLYINGEEVFNGTSSFIENKNNGRITFKFPGTNFRALSPGTLIGINVATWPQALPVADSYLLTWNASLDQWVPRVRTLTLDSLNGKYGNATLDVEELNDVIEPPSEAPYFFWRWATGNTPNPSAETATYWIGYTAETFWINTNPYRNADNQSIGDQSELIYETAASGMRMKVWVNGELYFDGICSQVNNRNNNRLDLAMGVLADGFTAPGDGLWQQNDVIGIWWDGLPGRSKEEGDVLVYRAVTDKWERTRPLDLLPPTKTWLISNRRSSGLLG